MRARVFPLGMLASQFYFFIKYPFSNISVSNGLQNKFMAI